MATKRLARLSVRMSEADMKLLKKIAGAHGVDTADVVRLLIARAKEQFEATGKVF